MALDTDGITALAPNLHASICLALALRLRPGDGSRPVKRSRPRSVRNRLLLVYQNAYVAQLEDNLQSLPSGPGWSERAFRPHIGPDLVERHPRLQTV
jgi:hypothetical protein